MNMSITKLHLAWDLEEERAKKKLYQERVISLLRDALDAAEIGAHSACKKRINSVIRLTSQELAKN